jgi:hypothetical protein
LVGRYTSSASLAAAQPVTSGYLCGAKLSTIKPDDEFVKRYEAELNRLKRLESNRLGGEECFQQAKGEAGLDRYQVRTWRAWYAHITLSMLALAWLAASRAQAEKRGSAPATRA